METKFLVSLIILQAIFSNANLIISPDRQSVICGKDGNFESDNLLKGRDEAFDKLDENFRLPGAYVGIERGNSDGVMSIGICPPYVKKDDCRSCVKQTIPTLKKYCPKQKEGAAWSVAEKLYCMVRYVDRRGDTKLAEWARFFPTTAGVPPAPGTVGELEKGLNNLANKLKAIVAATTDIAKKYQSGSISYGPGSRTLYGSMHCYDGLSPENCAKCLSEATNQIHDCYSKLRKRSGRAFSIHCAFWYAHDNFFPNTSSHLR